MNKKTAQQSTTTIMFFRNVIQGFISKYATKADTHEEIPKEDNDPERASRIQEVSAPPQQEKESSSMVKKLTEQKESSDLLYFEDGTIMNFNFVSITKDSDTESLFVEGDVWASRDLLFKATRVVANKQGFTVIRNSNRIECNRAGTVRTRKDTKEQRKMRGGQLKTGCTWQIRIKSLDKTLDLVGKKYRTDKFHPSARVQIIKACCDHTNCTPSAQNKNITAKRSGEYLKIFRNISYGPLY